VVPGSERVDEGEQWVTVLFFASAREAAGTSRACSGFEEGMTVGQLVANLRERYGTGLASVLRSCAVWVNGQPSRGEDLLAPGDEVAVLPPISGG